MGCRDCSHAYLHAGEKKCDLNPFDYQTTEQLAIVSWMRRVSRPWTDNGCPSFAEESYDEILRRLAAAEFKPR